MIERFGKARGLRLPIWKNRQVEFWFCPRGTKVPPHVHETLDSFIIYLAGKMSVTVGHKTRHVNGLFRRRESNGKLVFATRYIPAGERHCAEVEGGFAVFMNFERCHGVGVSASKDFVCVP